MSETIATTQHHRCHGNPMEINSHKSKLLCFGYCRCSCYNIIDPIVELIIIFMVLCDKFSLISSDLFISKNKQYIKFIKSNISKQLEYRSAFGNLLISFDNILDDQRSITWFGKFKIPSGKYKEEIYIGFTNFTHHMQKCPTDIEPIQGEVWLGFGINFYGNKLNVDGVIDECVEFPFGELRYCDLYYCEYPEVVGEFRMNVNFWEQVCSATINVKYNTNTEEIYKTLTKRTGFHYLCNNTDQIGLTYLKKGFLSVTLSTGCELQIEGINMYQAMNYETREKEKYI